MSLRFEAWTLPTSGTFEKKFDIVDALTGSGVRALSEYSDESLSLPSSSDLIDSIVTDTEGSWIRAYDGSQIVDEFRADRVAIPESRPSVRQISGPQRNGLVEGIAIYPKNWPNDKEGAQDWKWGYENALPPLGLGDLGSIREEWEVYLSGEAYSLDLQSATGGTFTLTVPGGTTAAIDFDANGSSIKSALEAVSGITDVSVTRFEDDSVKIVFETPKDLTSDMTLDDSGLTGSASLTKQNDGFDTGTNPTFTMTVNGDTTEALPWDASAKTVEGSVPGDAGLQGLSTVNDVAVSGSGTYADPWVITFYDPPDFPGELDVTFAGTEVRLQTIAGGVDPSPITISKPIDAGAGSASEHGSYSNPAIEVVTTNLDTGADWALKVNALTRFAGSQIVVDVTPGETYTATIRVKPDTTGTFKFVFRDVFGNHIGQAGGVLTAGSYQTLTVNNMVIPGDVNQVIMRIAAVDATPANIDTFYVNWQGATLISGEAEATFTQIIGELLDAAHERGTATFLERDATDAADSNGTSLDPISFAAFFGGNAHLGHVLGDGAQSGYAWRIVDAANAKVITPTGSHVLQIFKATNGEIEDQTATSGGASVTAGGKLESAETVRRIPPYTTILSHGAGALTREDTDVTAESNMGRIERVLDAEPLGTDTELSAFNTSRFAEEAANRKAASAVVLESDSSRPLVDYEEGSKVWWNFGSNLPKEARVVKRIAWTHGNVARYEVQGSSRLTPEAAMAKAVDHLLNQPVRRRGQGGGLRASDLAALTTQLCENGAIESSLEWRAFEHASQADGDINAEPANWKSVGYDDSVTPWVDAVVDNSGPTDPPSIRHPNSTAFKKRHEFFFRKEFFVTASELTGADVAVEGWADDGLVVYVNGSQVASAGTQWNAGPATLSATVARSAFQEGLNCVAVYAWNQESGTDGTAPNPGGVGFGLRIDLLAFDHDIGTSTHAKRCDDVMHASLVPISDLGGHYDSGNVEGALQEAAAMTGGDTFGDLGWFNAEDYGVVHDGVTDDTTAIQALIDAMHSAGGGVAYCPQNADGTRPVSLISGALQDTSTFNSQLKIPQSSGVTLRFYGPWTWRSDWNGTISGNPAVISAGLQDSLTINQVFLRFNQIRIEVPVNPKLTAMQFTKAATVRWNGLSIAPVSTPSSLPTNTNAVGLDLPWGLNDQNSGGDDLYIDGFYTGLRPSEQMIADAVYLSYCTRAVEMRGAQGSPEFLAHSVSIQRLNVWFCQRGIVATGDLRWLHVGLMDVEHDDPSFETVYDIDDASNFLRGLVRLHTTDFSTGTAVDDPLINGAVGLSLHLPHGKRWRLASIVDIPTGTNPSTNPGTGRRLYTDSSTGTLTVRKPDGTTVDLESGGASDLDDLGDVSAAAPNDNDILRYNSTSGDWETEALPAAGSATIIPNPTATAAGFASSATSITPTFSSAPASNSVLLAFIASKGRGADSISQTNVTWTRLVTNNGNNMWSEVWAGIPSGTPGTGVTINFTGSNAQNAFITELPNGTPQFDGAGTPTTNTGTGGLVTVGSHSMSDGEWVAMLQSSDLPASGIMSGNIPFAPISNAFGGTLRAALINAPDGKAAFWGENASSVAWHAMLVTLTAS